jgi:hypothetical protein
MDLVHFLGKGSSFSLLYGCSWGTGKRGPFVDTRSDLTSIQLGNSNAQDDLPGRSVSAVMLAARVSGAAADGTVQPIPGLPPISVGVPAAFCRPAIAPLFMGRITPTTGRRTLMGWRASIPMRPGPRQWSGLLGRFPHAQSAGRRVRRGARITLFRKGCLDSPFARDCFRNNA